MVRLADEWTAKAKECIAKVEAGPKGAVLAFRNDRFANPAGLVVFLQEQAGTAKLRPDQRLVLMRGWEDTRARLRGINAILKRLAEIAASAPTEKPATLPPQGGLAKRAGAGAGRR